MIKGEYRGASLGWLVAILVALGVWALIWGPDGDGEVPSEPLTTTIPSGNTDGPLIRASLPYDDGGEDAEVGGVLLLRDGCLVFEYGEDAAFGHLPIIWPGGTSWDAAAEAVVLPDGERVDIGDDVRGGGGYPYADALGWLDADAQQLAAACADSEWDEVARFNNRPDEIRIGS